MNLKPCLAAIMNLWAATAASAEDLKLAATTSFANSGLAEVLLQLGGAVAAVAAGMARIDRDQGTDGRLRVRLAADYERLDFLRVLRSRPVETIDDPGGVVRPPVPFGPSPAPDPLTLGEAQDGDG